MHLFLFDLFISVDNLCPIINNLPPKKVIICNVNAIQNFEKTNLADTVLKKRIKYYNYLPLSNKKKIFFYLIKIFLLAPCVILKKFRFLWLLIYKKIHFSSEKEIEKFLKLNKIKSITFEESAPKFIVDIFYRIAKRDKITVIKIASGLRTGKFNKLSKTQLNNCDYYISPNKVRGERKNQNIEKQIKYFGSLRFSKHWINKLKGTYADKFKKNSKIKIGFFKKLYSSERLQVESLIKKLKNDNNFFIKSREKPRDVNPLKCTKFHQDGINSSQLIYWSDVIISSRSSSMLIEAAINRKKIILLEYLNKKIKKSGVYNFRFISKAKSFDDLKKHLYKKNNLKNKEFENFINKFLINYFNVKKIKKDYFNFYKNLN